jgi:hypothetical protein
MKQGLWSIGQLDSWSIAICGFENFWSFGIFGIFAVGYECFYALLCKKLTYKRAYEAGGCWWYR